VDEVAEAGRQQVREKIDPLAHQVLPKS
jgi:hypothetical protein